MDKQAGIYRIYNTNNSKSYIGSTKNLNRRIKTHKQHLEKGCHNCRILQNDYDIDNSSIRYDILEVLEEDKIYLLTSYEKYYMYYYDSITKHKGYNIKLPTSNNQLFKEVCKIKLRKEEDI